MFDTPILFLIFNRPKETAKVFETIRKVRPKQLFIAADGPRLDKIEDIKRCEQTRLIVKKIDWHCEVKTLFRTENLGCGKAVSQAISWFFEHVEEGIILEDDCVPNQSFFDFSAIMLEKYRNNAEIMHISGTNHLFNRRLTPENNTYFFSAFNAIWGWATWRRAWASYDFEMDGWEKSQQYMQHRFLDKSFKQLLYLEFSRVASKKVDTWDWQWIYCIQKNNGLCITPMVNLVCNIGYEGTHYQIRHPHHNMPTVELKMNALIHPSEKNIDAKMDERNLAQRQFRKLALKDRIINKILHIWNRTKRFTHSSKMNSR
jgi:hypothetical protein